MTCFPTILFVHPNRELLDCLVLNLELEGYIVLRASDAIEALGIVRTHSRPIHLLVTDESDIGSSIAAELTQYRPRMDVLFLASYAREGASGPIQELALKEVRQTLESSGSHAVNFNTPSHRLRNVAAAKSARA